jgi:hypothetical protein
MKPPIETLKDLASSKEVGIVLRHDMTMGEQILVRWVEVFKVKSIIKTIKIFIRKQQMEFTNFLETELVKTQTKFLVILLS